MKKVSIITVCYNNLEGLRRTLDSVAEQTARNEIEHIVIDGGSTDGSKELLIERDSKIDYWVSEPDSGIFNAMNKGIKIASGEFCYFLNGGDVLSAPDIIEKCIPHLKGADILYGNQIVFDPKTGRQTVWEYPEKITPVHFMSSTLPHQATFIRTSLHKIHPYTERYKVMGDLIFFAERVFYDDAVSKKIPYSAGIFYLDGISMTNWDNTMKEKQIALNETFSEPLISELNELKYYREHSTLFLLKIEDRLGPIYRKIKSFLKL